MSSEAKARGINLGAGNWSLPGWIAIDSRHLPENGVLGPDTRLDAADSSLDYVFSSHFFEHVDDPTAQTLFNECFRVLKPGGGLRVSVPDFDLALQRYRADDHAFFDSDAHWGMAARYENWGAQGGPVTLEAKLAFAFANYANLADDGRFPPWDHIADYYCGPPRIRPEEIRDAALEHKGVVFSAWCVARLPPPSERNDTGHINAYDLDKFRVMLFRAGFRTVIPSSFRGSRYEELRQEDFDNRPTISLFVEAVKSA